MKKQITFMVALFLAVLFSCTNEQLDSDYAGKKEAEKPQSNLPDDTNSSDDGEHCVYTELIAGQHHSAGAVTIDVVGDNLVVTFTTNDDWVLGTTHLSIGVCDEDWVPTTRSGNPQIGQFEFTDPVFESDHEVVYIIPISEVGDNYCFAAHAEVEGPTGGETAWAEGTEFSGNSWAMYSEFILSECTSGGENGPT
jgi:hypothetical protein